MVSRMLGGQMVRVKKLCDVDFCEEMLLLVSYDEV
jgi:hypothetical protein